MADAYADSAPETPTPEQPRKTLKDFSEKDTDAILQEIRDRYTYAENAWKDIRSEGDTDMRYIAGDPWDPKAKQARKDAGRPYLSLDELGQYVNQAVNDVRVSKRAIKFSPVGDGANDDTAQFYQDKTREIEYRSKSNLIYTTAFENAVQRGFGYCRIVTKYRPKSFEQELWLEPIVNPNTVLPDPDFRMPTGSDMGYCFVLETRTRKEFPREFPKAKATSFSADQIALAPQWIKENQIQIAEYWTVKKTKQTLLQLELQGVQRAIYQSELPKGTKPKDGVVVFPGGTVWTVTDQREEDVPQVCQYLTNGIELLDYSEWPGKYIPIAMCLGKVLYLNEGSGTTRKILSLTRLARDPFMLYCYYRTAEAELVGMTPKTPFIGYIGQFRGQEDQWQKVNHEPLAYLEANPLTERTGAQVLPLPQRQPYDPPIAALELGAEAARRAIQAAMGGAPLPTQAQRRNEKSGVALKQIEESSQKGSFHFVDHYHDMIDHVGVMLEDLIDKIYDTARDVGVLKNDDEPATVRINDPNAQEQPGQPKPLPSTKGQHVVTVSTGPSFDSEREAASDFADTLVQNPQVFPLIASEVVKLKNLGPIGDKIAEILEVMKPPELRQPKPGEAPNPQQVQMQLVQMQQENGQLKQMLNDLAKKLETKTIEANTELQKTQMEIASRERIEAAKAGVTLQTDAASLKSDNDIAELKAAVDLLKAGIDARTKQIDAMLRHKGQDESRTQSGTARRPTGSDRAA